MLVARSLSSILGHLLYGRVVGTAATRRNATGRGRALSSRARFVALHPFYKSFESYILRVTRVFT